MSSSPDAAFERRWAELAPIGRSGETGGYRRYAWTATDLTLREWFTAECTTLGLDLVEDRAGNLWGWWGDPDSAAAQGNSGVAVGSHLDSVPDGGAFDGPLGVVAALGAVELLMAAAGRNNPEAAPHPSHRPRRPIGVVCFADEEGARFGLACTGSRLLTGELDGDRARALRDGDGTTLAQAWQATGRDPAAMAGDPEAMRRIGCFVEVHVEQGRALALPELAAPAAVATGIWPHGRWRIDLPGAANHAGTTALADRQDAMLALAEVVLAARAAATEQGCLATVGKVRVAPGAVNAVPSSATGWLDARGASADAVQAVVAAVSERVARLGGQVTRESWTPLTSFDGPLSDRLRAATGGAAVPLLATGAGHDAGVLATAGIPAAMLFVRNPTGVSHSPAEHADTPDCVHSVEVLRAFLAAEAFGAGDSNL